MSKKNVRKYAIADLHLGHDKTWSEFTRADGSPLRHFKSSEEMNRCIIDRWNATVRSIDTCYILGDVVINKTYISLLRELQGKIILVGGNHDKESASVFLENNVADFKGVVEHSRLVLTHIPVHTMQLERRWQANVHGHTHEKLVPLDPGGDIPDPRYTCVSVEQVDYTPADLNEIARYHEWRNRH